MGIEIVALPDKDLSAQRQNEWRFVFVGTRAYVQLLAEVTVIGQPVTILFSLSLVGFAQEAERILQIRERYSRFEFRKWIEHVESFARRENLSADYGNAGSKCVGVE